jgi:hypothetical protein
MAMVARTKPNGKEISCMKDGETGKNGKVTKSKPSGEQRNDQDPPQKQELRSRMMGKCQCNCGCRSAPVQTHRCPMCGWWICVTCSVTNEAGWFCHCCSQYPWDRRESNGRDGLLPIRRDCSMAKSSSGILRLTCPVCESQNTEGECRNCGTRICEDCPNQCGLCHDCEIERQWDMQTWARHEAEIGIEGKCSVGFGNVIDIEEGLQHVSPPPVNGSCAQCHVWENCKTCKECLQLVCRSCMTRSQLCYSCSNPDEAASTHSRRRAAVMEDVWSMLARTQVSEMSSLGVICVWKVCG